jgi:ATP-binding protein involved in chromosome partitioning
METIKTGNKYRPLNIRKIVAVGAGKGGVGKSTVTCLLAARAAASGQLKVGILDADLYGPSVPTIFGLEGVKVETNEDGKIIPVNSDLGLKVMSFGFFTSNSTPVVWRGPMVSKALIQLLKDVDWGELDILFIDMPPGTGDVQLTILENFGLDEAVIVTTPQEVSWVDAKKALRMFKKAGVPVGAVVENMSYFICDNCEKKHSLFIRCESGTQEVEEFQVRRIEIPFDPMINQMCDLGNLGAVARDEGQFVKLNLQDLLNEWVG